MQSAVVLIQSSVCIIVCFAVADTVCSGVSGVLFGLRGEAECASARLAADATRTRRVRRAHARVPNAYYYDSDYCL